MQWPNTSIQGEQPSEGIAASPPLMQWAAVTYHFLRQLRPIVNCEVPWLNMPRSEASIQMPCRCSFPTVQLCLPSAVATNLLTQFELHAYLERSCASLRNYATQKATKERVHGLKWRVTGTGGGSSLSRTKLCLSYSMFTQTQSLYRHGSGQSPRQISGTLLQNKSWLRMELISRSGNSLLFKLDNYSSSIFIHISLSS